MKCSFKKTFNLNLIKPIDFQFKGNVNKANQVYRQIKDNVK